MITFVEWMRAYFPDWKCKMTGSGLIPTWYRNGHRDEFSLNNLRALWQYEVKEGYYDETS